MWARWQVQQMCWGKSLFSRGRAFHCMRHVTDYMTDYLSMCVCSTWVFRRYLRTVVSKHAFYSPRCLRAD